MCVGITTIKFIPMKYTIAILCLCLNAGLFAQSQQLYAGCVTDDEGHPMMYVDMHTIDGKQHWETDLDGCFNIPANTPELKLVFSYPKYANDTINIRAGLPVDVKMLLASSPQAILRSVQKERPGATLDDIKIGGVVVDENGDPLIGASVLIVGSSVGTITDLDGFFELPCKEEKATVQVSYIGYSNYELETKVGEPVVIKMEENAVALEEVTVTKRRGIGLGRMLRGRSSGSSPSMAKDYAAPPTAEPAMMMATDVAPVESAAYDDAMSMPESAEKVVEEIEEMPDAGQLTAGEINDFSKWDMWNDISQEDLGRHRSVWQQFPDHRFTLQLTNQNGFALPNASVALQDGQGNTLWRSRTDVQGRAELWAHYFTETRTAANGLTIVGSYAGQEFELKDAKSFRNGINFHTLAAPCLTNAKVDIAFVVDATGSMGDEISYLQSELLDVIKQTKDSLPEADLQLGSVFYRDHGDEYLTREQALTSKVETTIDFIKKQTASGGGDMPEAVESALEVALEKMNWRDDASTRLLFLVLDAPPHEQEAHIKRMQIAATKAATHGIQIIPVACSGINKSTEYLMRALALASNGTYTFLTDHSGIGNAHIEPSTDSYKVEHLNEVLLRLCVSRSRLSSCTDAPVAMAPSLLPSLTPSTSLDWKVYPNPTTGPVNLSFVTGDTEEVALLDVQGKLLQRFAANERSRLDLSTYPAGMYYLRKGSGVAALVLQHFN